MIPLITKTLALRRSRSKPAIDWTAVRQRLVRWIEAAGVTVEGRRMGPQTTGVFDGTSITTNAECEVETQCHNIGHALGHIVQWSLDAPRFQALYDALYAAKDRRDEDPAGLERALAAFREYEVEASEYAAWLLVETGNTAALSSFTPFARADIEAIVGYHRTGTAPIWSEFFADWKARAARGDFVVRPFAPRPIPPFIPRPIAAQEIVRAVRGVGDAERG